MFKASQAYLQDKRQFQEAAEAQQRRVADLEAQLAAERKSRWDARLPWCPGFVCGRGDGRGGLRACFAHCAAWGPANPFSKVGASRGFHLAWPCGH